MTKEEFQAAMKNAPEKERREFGVAVSDAMKEEYWAGNPGLMSIQNSHTGEMSGSNYGRFKRGVKKGIQDGIADGSITDFKLDPRRNDPSFNPQFEAYFGRDVSDPLTGNQVNNPDTGNRYQYGETIAPNYVENTSYGGRTDYLGDRAYDSRDPNAAPKSRQRVTNPMADAMWTKALNTPEGKASMVAWARNNPNNPMSQEILNAPMANAMWTKALNTPEGKASMVAWARNNPDNPMSETILSA